MKYDVLGIDNALMDLLVQSEYGLLDELGLARGTMHLIDDAKAKEIEARIAKVGFSIAPGGSAANTVATIARLGGRTVFYGSVSEDDYGRAFEGHLRSLGVQTRLVRSDGMTGRAVTFITPDSERTFATHLGVAGNLPSRSILEEDVKNSKIVHVTGYYLESPVGKKAALRVMQLAKKHGVKVSVDLSDHNLIKRNIRYLKKIVRDYADILFVNEQEAQAFTGKEAEEALHELAEIADIAVVKLGERGSLVKHRGNVFRIECVKANAIDTTGAGDSYAAGFLYCLSRGCDVETSGRVGSFIAARVVEKIGAHVGDEVIEEVHRMLGSANSKKS